MPQSREQQATALSREAQVLEYRKAGLTFAQIAPMIDPPYADASGAKLAYDRAIERTIIQPANEQRELMLLQIDQLWATFYPKALGGNIYAVRECNRLMIRKSKLLGLDAPTSHRLIVTDAMQAEIEALAAELGLSLDPVPAEPGRADFDDADERETERA